MTSFQADGMKEAYKANYDSYKSKITEEIKKEHSEKLFYSSVIGKMILALKIKWKIIISLRKRFGIDVLYLRKYSSLPKSR